MDGGVVAISYVLPYAINAHLYLENSNDCPVSTLSVGPVLIKSTHFFYSKGLCGGSLLYAAPFPTLNTAHTHADIKHV